MRIGVAPSMYGEHVAQKEVQMESSGAKNGSYFPGSPGLAKQLDDKDGFSLFQAFLNRSDNFCWIMDKDENLVYANKALLQHCNFGKAAIGKNIFTVFPAELALLLRQQDKTEKLPDLIDPGRSLTSAAVGQKTVFSVQVFPLYGIAEEWYGGIASDLSDQAETEQQLFACNEKWLAFTKNSFQGVWEWEVSSPFIHCNEALKKMMGFAEDRQCNIEDWLCHIHPLDRDRVRNNIQKVISGDSDTWEEEYRFLTNTEQRKTILDRGLVIQENGRPLKLIGAVSDITEQKELEQQLHHERQHREQELAHSILQVQEQERFHLGQELHDNVCQILTTAKLMLDMLETRDSQQGVIKEKSSGLVLKALNELRALSKELALPQLRFKSLNTAIAELLEEIRYATQLNVSYVNTADDIENLDTCKKVALFRIVQEQVKNIIRHAKASRICLKLHNRRGLVELEIKDDGVGFDTEKSRRGVGLSSIFERTKACNGNMKLESTPGKGTRLLVVFSNENTH